MENSKAVLKINGISYIEARNRDNERNLKWSSCIDHPALNINSDTTLTITITNTKEAVHMCIRGWGKIINLNGDNSWTVTEDTSQSKQLFIQSVLFKYKETIILIILQENSHDWSCSSPYLLHVLLANSLGEDRKSWVYKWETIPVWQWITRMQLPNALDFLITWLDIPKAIWTCRADIEFKN